MARGNGYFYGDEYRYERFITTIQQKAGISWDKAERAAQATLETLAERISFGEARDLAEDLPHEVATWLLSAAGDAEAFDAEQFIRRVAAREDVDTDTAEKHVRAVLIALARLVRKHEIRDLISELPSDYDRLIRDAVKRSAPGADPPEVMPVDELIDRVEGRAGLDRAAAHRATEAVLETLAERIAGGEVDDIAENLPAPLRDSLERGKERTGGKAQRMSLDEFVARVAEREGVTWEEALDHAHAVFTTLREALPDKEISDLLAELPRGYSEALL